MNPTVTIPVIGTPVPRARARANMMPLAKHDALIAKFQAMCAQGPSSAIRALLKNPGQFFRVNVHSDKSKACKAWERAIKHAARENIPELRRAGIVDASGIAYKDDHYIVSVAFIHPRPKMHFGTGKNADKLKDRFEQAFVSGRSDLDNAAKLVLDVLVQESLIPDDSHCQRLNLSKRYTKNGTTGALIEITKWQPEHTYPKETP